LQALTQIAGVLVGLVLFAAAFIFASLILALAALGALLLWGWVMWRTRQARRAAGRASDRRGSLVIEGEYVVDREERAEGAREDPKDPRA